jgi:hypothetical protein
VIFHSMMSTRQLLDIFFVFILGPLPVMCHEDASTGFMRTYISISLRYIPTSGIMGTCVHSV